MILVILMIQNTSSTLYVDTSDEEHANMASGEMIADLLTLKSVKNSHSTVLVNQMDAILVKNARDSIP